MSPSNRKFRFDVYPDRKGEFRWRLVAGNGRVIADSGEGYTRRASAEKGARRTAWAIAEAETVQLDARGKRVGR